MAHLRKATATRRKATAIPNGTNPIRPVRPMPKIDAFRRTATATKRKK